MTLNEQLNHAEKVLVDLVLFVVERGSWEEEEQHHCRTPDIPRGSGNKMRINA